MKEPGGERLEALRKKLRDDPRSLVFVELSEELNRAALHAEASEVAQRGLLSHPDSVAGRLALAVAEAEQDHIREALEQIKRALLIDQENPKALALMGRILLKKGLAKRAVQFLTHAVKLDPKDKEYGELLKEAKALSKNSSEDGGMPVFDGDQVPDSSSPWNEDEASSRGVNAEAEHTVFDPDAVKKLNKKKKSAELDQALSNLPAVGEDLGEEEPTKFHHRNQASQVINPKKAKMGGSAAEYSQMMKKADAEAATNEAERRVREAAAAAPSPPPPPVPPVSDLGAKPLEEKPPEKEIRPPPKAPSVERELKAEPAAEKPIEKPVEKPAEEEKKPEKKKPAVEKAEKAEKPEKKEPSAPKPSPNKQVGHMATRMVDEALWALLGKGPEEGKRPEPDAPAERAKPEKAEKPAKAKEEAAPEPRAGGPMVVRTSERFGQWTGIAVLLILCVASLWSGYAIVLATHGPAPEQATEELKGIATDLETGGLASYLAAEEKIAELERTNPDLKVLLSGAMAEVYARRWESFGRDPKLLEQAKEQIKLASVERPSVELLAAMTVVSTGAQSRSTIDAELERSASEYKESPKIWVLRAKVAQLDGRTNDVPVDLYRALAINPQHRLTLLELARWHASQGAYGTAFALFDQLQDKHPLDVEAAIDRYVLGKVSGKDPNEAQAVSTLAGLVRDEIQDVAKDETGRAALAFATPRLAKGELVEGIEELSKADAAFQGSAEFKTALAGMYLSVAEWARAREQYKQASELEPENAMHRIGIARATLGERSGRKLVAEDEKKRAKGLTNGVADLPFATVKMVPGRFQIVDVEPDASFFPEGEYLSLAKEHEGAELQKLLEAASLRALARIKSQEGKHDEAINFLREATTLANDASSEYALGMAYLAKKDWDEATRLLKNAIDKNDDDVAAKLGLARAWLGKGEVPKALEVLDKIGADVTVPDALLMIGKLKVERGDYEGAIAKLEPLVAMMPKHQLALILYGEALMRVGRDKEADELFARALAAGAIPAEKVSSTALVGLGRVESKTNAKHGIALLRKAEQVEDVPDEVHFYLGEALVLNKKAKEGKKELERYLKLSQNAELKKKALELMKRK